MQTKTVIVHVFRFWRMKLHDAFVLIPKQVFNMAHFAPCWTAIWEADGNVIPSAAVATNDTSYLPNRHGYAEHSIESVRSIASRTPLPYAMRFKKLSGHMFHGAYSGISNFRSLINWIKALRSSAVVSLAFRCFFIETSQRRTAMSYCVSVISPCSLMIFRPAA